MRSRTTLAFLIILPVMATASPAEKRVQMTIRSGSYDSAPYEWMRSEVGKFVEQSKTAEPSLIATQQLVKKLHTFVNQPAKKKESPADRQGEAMKVLGKENYEGLEIFFLKQLASEDTERVETAMIALSQCLFSLRAREPIRQILESAVAELGGRDPLEAEDPVILFAAGEALSYYGEAEQVRVLSACLDDQLPKSYRIRAIRALANIDDRVNLAELVGPLLDDEDPDVAYRASEHLIPRMADKSRLHEAALRQFERLSGKITAGTRLSFSERGLLLQIGNILAEASREDALTSEQQDKARELARKAVLSGSVEEAEAAAYLFAVLARDEDADVIGERMLGSESRHSRWTGAFAVANLSAEVQKQFIPRLIEMLDDENRGVRVYALRALRDYMGEKSPTAISDEELKQQSERVKRELEKTEK